MLPVPCQAYMRDWLIKTWVPDAGISGRDTYLHPTVFCGMQLLTHAWETCFWHQSPQFLNQCWLIVNYTTRNIFRISTNFYAVLKFWSRKCHLRIVSHFVMASILWLIVSWTIWLLFCKCHFSIAKAKQSSIYDLWCVCHTGLGRNGLKWYLYLRLWPRPLISDQGSVVNCCN